MGKFVNTAANAITLLLAYLAIFSSHHSCEAIAPEVEELIRAWAPIVWLHSEEKFLPSSVEFFLPEVTVQDADGNVTQEVVTPDTLIGGEKSSLLHMQTRAPLDCPACYNLDVFFGQSGSVPVYTLYREYNDTYDTLDVSYHAFYPYNRGKDACVGLVINGECVGAQESLGNHVGDWEHNTIRFRNGQPYQIYISVHSFGAFYAWNETSGVFEFTEGEPVRSVTCSTSGQPEAGEFEGKYKPPYPPIVEVMGTHPVVYSANGSHGLWSLPGGHTYVPGIPLQDFTDQGYAWNTWDNLVLIPWQPEPSNYEGNLSWLNYLGDWGNSPQGCEFDFVIGECQLGSGPSGPRRPQYWDFPNLTYYGQDEMEMF